MKTPALLISLFALLSCISCNSNNFDKEALSTAADTQSATGFTGDSVKMVKKASMNFKVKDVSGSTKNIIRMARSMNGFVTQRSMESVENETKMLKIKDDSVQTITSYIVRAELLVRIPAEKMDDFIEMVSNSASFIHNINVQIDDKSLQYLASQIKQRNSIQLLRDEKSKDHKTREAIELMKSQNQAVDEEIAARNIEADVKYSTVQLNFFQNALIKKETIAENNLSGYRLPFFRSMKNAFSDGWNYFLTFIIGITHFWMFLLAIGAIIIGYRYYKLRKITA